MKDKKMTVFYVFVSFALCAGIALSGLTLYGQRQTAKVIQQMQGIAEDVNQEDDVTIAGEYLIKSTLPISEAYQSGDTSKLDDADKETLDMATEVLDGIIKDGMSDYEKEKAVYIWLTSKLKGTAGILTVVPDLQNENYTPHDVLKYHSAVCVGYATTFRMFMQMLGTECKVVHDTGLSHSWDLVKLEDGWYHTDCYMDSDTAAFANFNMDDTMCAQNHDWNREFFPAAKGVKYNYILSICEELKNIYSIPKWLVKAINARKGAVSATFKAPFDEETEKAAAYLVDSLCEQINYNDLSVSSQWVTNSEGKYVLCFQITYYDAGNTDVESETTEKIDEAIAKAMENMNSADSGDENI